MKRNMALSTLTLGLGLGLSLGLLAGCGKKTEQPEELLTEYIFRCPNRYRGRGREKG